MPAEEVVTVLPPRTITTVKDSVVRRMSVHATDTDVRSLVMGIAAQGGLNVVVSPEVRSRISIWVDDVTPLDALTAVMTAAHLSLAPTKLSAPWGPAVFFQPAVNIDSMSVAQLQRRFDIMRETAEFIVQSRRAAQKP